MGTTNLKHSIILKAMAAMKAMKAAKGMKKAKRVSTIATGKRSKASVFRGTKVKTSGGLKKADIMKNKAGKLVSRKSSAASKKRFNGSSLQKWGQAVKAARKALGLKGFVAIKKGSPVYNKAKSLYKK